MLVIDIYKMKHYIDEYFSMCLAIQQMKNSYDLNYLEVHGKDLIESPKTIILSMCQFLGVLCSDLYLEICSNKLNQRHDTISMRYYLMFKNL